MPISPRGKLAVNELLNPSRQTAFTLLEVMVVIFILALFVGIVSPRLNISSDQYLRREALHFRNVLQWATEQSLYEGQHMQVAINLEESSYQLLTIVDKKAFAVTDNLVKQRTLKPGVGHLSWGLDQNNISTESTITVEIGAWGPLQPIMLRFSDDEGEGGYQVIYTSMQFRPLVQSWST